MALIPSLMCGSAMLRSLVEGCSHIENALIYGVLGDSDFAFAPQAGTNAQIYHG